MKGDSKLIVHASSHAQKAFDFVDKQLMAIDKNKETKQILDKYSRATARNPKEAERERGDN